MKLAKYIEKLQGILDTRGDFDVIYSKDDEGNGYQEVYYDPSLGFYEAREFQSESDEEFDLEINAICIN